LIIHISIDEPTRLRLEKFTANLDSTIEDLAEYALTHAAEALYFGRDDDPVKPQEPAENVVLQHVFASKSPNRVKSLNSFNTRNPDPKVGISRVGFCKSIDKGI